jgi:hypothetical protein
MPTIVGTFRANGALVGVDNRVRLAGLDLLVPEAVREVKYKVRLATGIFGTSTPAPVDFFDLVVGVAFGLDASTPPDFDPKTNAAGWDWLSVAHGVSTMLPRPTTTANNGWGLEILADSQGWRACPRLPVTTTTSIWLVTNPISLPAAGGEAWQADCYLEYRSTT